MPAGPAKDLHQCHGRFEVAGKPLRCFVDREPGPQVLTLGRDTDGAVVGVTRPHADTSDRLQRGVRDGDPICTERQCFDEVGRCPQPARDDERDMACICGVEVLPGAGKRRNRRHRDVVAEEKRHPVAPPRPSRIT